MAAARPSQAAVPSLPAATRKTLLDLVERGCRVKVTPDGTIHIDPPAPETDDPFASVDWSR